MRRIIASGLTALLAFSFLLAASGTAGANVTAGGGFSSSYVGESVFLAQAAGGSGTFSAIFFNDGTQSWSPGDVGLLICATDKVTCNVPRSDLAPYASGWLSSTVYSTVTATVAPGQNGFFSYKIVVPAGTAGGTTATFNGDVGLIATGAELRPEGYFQSNTTPTIAGTLSISPTTASVGVSAQQQFTATTNLSGTVSWSVNGGCGAVTSAGLFVGTAMNSSTQPCSVVASIGGLTASASITVFGPAQTLGCSATPSTLVTGGNTSTVSVSLKDANGNLVSNASTPTITLVNNTPTFASISPSGSVTPSGGVATTTVTSLNAPGNIVISASASGLTGCSATITSSSAGPSAKTAASFNPNPIASDGTSTTTLRVDIQDSAGNRNLSDSSTVISVSRDAGSNVCSITGVTTGTSGTFGAGSASATAVQGRVEFSVVSTTTPGTCTMTATTNNTSVSGSSASLTTQIVGSANKLSIASNDSPHQVGSTSTTNVVVEVDDANGARLTGSTLSIAAALDSATCTGAGGGNVVISSSGSTSQGRATFAFTSNGAYAGCVVRFNATNVTGTSTTIVFTSAAADHLGCSFSPAQIINDGASTSTGTVKIQDTFGNTVPAGSYSVTFSHSGAQTVLVTSSPQPTSAGFAYFTVHSTTTTGTDTYTAQIASGTTPTLPNTTAATCTISVQSSLP